MNRRISRLVLAIGIAFVSMLGLVIGVSGSALATPPTQFCSTATGTGQPNCFNVKGGVHNPNTEVIGYTPGDNNNNFFEKFLDGKCGDGKVHNTPGGLACPFPIGSQLNARYDGDEIVALEDGLSANLCVGADEDTTAGLTTCPDENGNNGGLGTIVVENSVHGRGSTQGPFYFINFHWSEFEYETGGPANTPYFECSFTRRNSIFTAQTSGQSGFCTFQGIVH